MSKEKEFLDQLSQLLHSYADDIRELEEDSKVTEKMHVLLKETVLAEKELREQHDVGVRFNVIRSQLHSLLAEFEKELAELQSQKSNPTHTSRSHTLKDGESTVYVYLFNSRGKNLKSWQALLTSQALMEHSVHRPIHADLAHVQEILRTKTPKENHAYLEIIVKQSDILEGHELRDAYEHPLLRLKQGALKIENLKCFHHQKTDYRVSPEGGLSKV